MPNLWRGESDAELVAALESGYPSLRLVVGAGRRAIRGAFNIEHEGMFLASYQIEVLLDDRDILGLPKVKEVGGRIPRSSDRHVNAADGVACLYLPEDLVVRTSEPFDIVSFLNGPVRTFFLGQAGVEMGMPFPLGEWAHGTDGLKQMLTELLGFDSAEVCVSFLELLSRKIIKGHWQCPCGSRRPLRACHQDHVRGLRQRVPLQTWRFLVNRARELPRAAQ